MKTRTHQARGLGRGPAHGFVVEVAIGAPGAEHHVGVAQVAADEGHQLLFPFAQGAVGKAAADPLQAVQGQAQATQGFGAFLGPEHAQAALGPQLRPGMAGAAVADGNQLQRVAVVGQYLQQAAAGDHFVTGVRGDYHCPGAGRNQVGQIDGRHLGQAAGTVPDLAGPVAVDCGYGFHGVSHPCFPGHGSSG